jgi:glutamate dehydrogenase (NAD(P)+)
MRAPELTVTRCRPAREDAKAGLGSTAVRVIELRDDRLALEAFVVIDHELFPISAGGTRMLPDVDVQEVTRLARAMTWKFAACRVPYAGAKAGIRFAGGDRAAVLAAYKRALEPYRDIFVTGPDMGTSPVDFLDGGEEPFPLWARSHEGLGMDDLATGHGVKAAAEAALAHLGRTFDGAAVAIEGFGKVGAGTARACARAGARIVGVSTVEGLLADPDGLDVEELLALRERHGDRCVAHGPRPVRPRDELFELECDVLVPGARPDSIGANVARRLRCAAVAPGANIPYGFGALEILHDRSILAVPDFVSNSGGVHLYETVVNDEPEPALAAIAEIVREAVLELLAASDELGVTPVAAGFRAARAYLAETTGASTDVLDALFPD